MNRFRFTAAFPVTARPALAAAVMVCRPRRGGDVHDPLVLAGLSAHRDRGVSRAPGAVREAAGLRQPAAAVRPGDRTAHRLAPWELPPGLLPPATTDKRHPDERTQ